MKTQQSFEEYLKKNNLSGNTLDSYLWTVDFYHSHYDGVTKENLLAYKGYLMEFFKPKTVNLRIQAMNKYLAYLGKEKLHLKAVKIQQKNFLENVMQCRLQFSEKTAQKGRQYGVVFCLVVSCGNGRESQ